MIHMPLNAFVYVRFLKQSSWKMNHKNEHLPLESGTQLDYNDQTWTHSVMAFFFVYQKILNKSISLRVEASKIQYVKHSISNFI
jgi:hypothetical protein